LFSQCFDLTCKVLLCPALGRQFITGAVAKAKGQCPLKTALQAIAYTLEKCVHYIITAKKPVLAKA
jgi:hypothetical protein